ncbi:MAG: MerR family transcriptional regulator, partial [Pseudobdellovibrionaceae bacterium]
MDNDNQPDPRIENQVPLNQPTVFEPEEIYLASSIPLVERSTLFDFMLSSQDKTNVKSSSESNNESGLQGVDQFGVVSCEVHLADDDVCKISSSQEALPVAGKSKTEKGKVELEEHLKMLCDAELLEQIHHIPRRISFKIGEVADLVGVKSFVLRFWETEFDLLKPKKASNNQRMYSRKDVEVSFLIKKLLYRD